MLDFITETHDVWQNTRSCGRPLVLYGMGNGADAILDRMAAEGLTAAALFASDEFVRGQSFRGFMVEHYADIKARLGDFASITPILKRVWAILPLLLPLPASYRRCWHGLRLWQRSMLCLHRIYRCTQVAKQWTVHGL